MADEDVPGRDFAAAIQRTAAAAEKVNRTSSEPVTQFELLTAAAFSELARREVEVAVVEAGLGGRWDATNVLGAEVVVLTNVGLEHTRWLGPTIADIAGEKLAVVREDATLVLGDDAPEVVELARATGATIVRPTPTEDRSPGYQRINFSAAAPPPGRFSVEPGARFSARPLGARPPAGRRPRPLTIYDGAHNAPGIAALAASVPEGTVAVRVDPRRQGRGRDAARAAAAAERRRFTARPTRGRSRPPRWPTREQGRRRRLEIRTRPASRGERARELQVRMERCSRQDPSTWLPNCSVHPANEGRARCERARPQRLRDDRSRRVRRRARHPCLLRNWIRIRPGVLVTRPPSAY